MKITLHTIRFENFEKTEETVEEITEEQYDNYVNSIEFFRGLGGKESVSRGNTKYGKRVLKLISGSPSGETVVKRHFSFD